MYIFLTRIIINSLSRNHVLDATDSSINSQSQTDAALKYVLNVGLGIAVL